MKASRLRLWGDSGEQTAPLGRAVIGGLVAATAATLLLLPMIFAIVQRNGSVATASIDPDDPASPRFDGVPGTQPAHE